MGGIDERSHEIAKDIDRSIADSGQARENTRSLEQQIERRGSEIAQDIRDNISSERNY